MINVNELPALEFDAGLANNTADDAVTSIGGIIAGIVTGIIAGISANAAVE
ncbi:hypothetical protein GCM10007973_12580 [Polymorphobacter multimanifer]|uniref:Branched-subunit amino acid transport protein n=1 Tax=Polymorphobacter multimanifer TaxID=1070431 RepID=A0A841L907_9SPHN|nr:hypothetical protein [Polymorphobacter multimanifer]MBB6229034.1 branched-subunit amino acid transport protein [Polymorphobacter multimanifer]GGI77160.1 hypothetical protein GCM10007973_12580 [Polymorphobacter multimanifer]